MPGVARGLGKAGLAIGLGLVLIGPAAQGADAILPAPGKTASGHEIVPAKMASPQVKTKAKTRSKHKPKSKATGQAQAASVGSAPVPGRGRPAARGLHRAHRDPPRQDPGSPGGHEAQVARQDQVPSRQASQAPGNNPGPQAPDPVQDEPGRPPPAPPLAGRDLVAVRRRVQVQPDRGRDHLRLGDHPAHRRVLPEGERSGRPARAAPRRQDGLRRHLAVVQPQDVRVGRLRHGQDHGVAGQADGDVHRLPALRPGPARRTPR